MFRKGQKHQIVSNNRIRYTRFGYVTGNQKNIEIPEINLVFVKSSRFIKSGLNYCHKCHSRQYCNDPSYVYKKKIRSIPKYLEKDYLFDYE